MVGKICTVCRRCSFNEKQLSFFTYPCDPLRRQKWLIAVDRLDLMDKLDNIKTRANHRICETHFEEKYIKKSKKSEGRKSLAKDAFPTLNLDNPIPMLEGLCTPNVILREYLTRKEVPNTTLNLIKNESTTTMQVIKPIQTDVKPMKVEPLKQPIPVKVNIKPAVKRVKPMNHTSSSVRNNESLKIKGPPSPPPYGDLLEFCESVMKVSKSTQTLTTENSRRRNQDNVTNKMEIEDDRDCDKTSFTQLCLKYLTRNLSKVIQWSLQPTNNEQNVNFILFSLHLYYSSNSYNLLRSMLCLPNEEALKYFLLPKTTKLSDNYVNALKCKVNNMSARERLCSFSVSSVLLKPNLYYNIKHDRIIGLHDINGKQSIGSAKYAIILILRGILVHWKQPIAYAFISNYDYYQEISTWIDEVLIQLINIGFDVRAFVSNPQTEFLYKSPSRIITSEKTYFTINGTDIFYVYDSLQLLRIVKNNLKFNDIYYGPEPVTNSNNDFSEKVNDLISILNAKSRFANKPYERTFSNKKYQTEFLEQMLKTFANLRVLRRNDGADVTENIKFIEGFQITVKSVLQLFKELSVLGVKHLITSRLSQSCFDKLKQLGKEECTPRQFHKCFVRSLVFNMLKRPVGDRNSMFESEEFCLQLLDKEFQDTPSNCNLLLKIYTTDYRQGLPEKNAFVFVCGYCYLKCIQRHCCETLKGYMNYCQEKQNESNAAYLCSISLDLNMQNSKMLPPDSFTEIVMIMETTFKEYFTPDRIVTSIGRDIFDEYDKLEFELPCPCFPIDYLKALFIRVRLFYMIRKNNRLHRKKKGIHLPQVFSL